jgi:hypothetical protein
MILSRESMKPPKDTRGPTMRKLELCYSIGKKQKFKELYHGLQMNGGATGYPLYQMVGQMLEINI